MRSAIGERMIPIMKLRIFLPVMAAFLLGSLMVVASTGAASPGLTYRVALPMLVNDEGVAASPTNGAIVVETATPTGTVTGTATPTGTVTATPTGTVTATPTGTATPPPPPGPGYCGPSPMTVPPPPDGRLAGTLTLNGVAAPAGTLVAVTFNGLPGPYAYTTDAGAYRVDYHLSSEAGCINQGTAAIGIWVGGVTKFTGVTASTAVASILYPFNVATP